MTLAEFIASPAGQARSQSAWAASAGVSKSYFSELVSGARVPSVEVAKRISMATNGQVPWVSFFTEDAA